MKIQIPDPQLAEFFREREGFLVGGTVRDLFLGRDPIDYDIAVAGPPEPVARDLARRLEGHLVVLGKPSFQVCRIITRSREVDVVPLFGGSIDADLENRDFTINAMALSLTTGRLIDPLGGRRDLMQKRIRMVSASAFRADPLRLLRTYRFGAGLSFVVDPDTQAAVARNAGRIRQPAGERIKAELFKMLAAPFSAPYLRLAAAAGLFAALFPGLLPRREGAGAPPDLDPLERLEQMLAGARPLPAAWQEARLALAPAKRVLLKFSLLFPTDEPASAGDRLLETVVTRLKCSNFERQFLARLLQGRRAADRLLSGCRPASVPIIRFFRQQEETVPLVLLALLAGASGRGDSTGPAADLMYTFAREYQPRRARPPLLSGRDLIRAFGLSPSPRFRFILDRVEEARLAGRIHTRQEALDLAGRLLDRAGRG